MDKCKPRFCNFIIKETLVLMFFCEFAKHLRAPFLQNTFGRLILFVGYCVNEQLIEPRAFNIKRP